MKRESTYFVTMNDPFMSNWGHSKGLKNHLIFICDSFEQARIVAENAANRKDMECIQICSHRPKHWRNGYGNDYKDSDFYVQIKTINDYPAWYKPGYFKR